ncbi:MAG: DUF3810 domain-containing protein [Clostridia bacterium]|nr:DUF3810 domain-containing protein [Clostridia bacterium]
MIKAGFSSFIKRNRFFIICAAILLSCAALQTATRLSSTLADALTFGLSAHIRAALAFITSFIPFSLGETAVIILPLLCIVVFLFAIFSRNQEVRIIKGLLSVLTVMYLLFALSFVPAYGTSSAETLFELDAKPVSTDALCDTAEILVNEINVIADSIDFDYGSFSRIGYDLNTLSKKLVYAYDTLKDEYGFIFNFNSKLKPIALSHAMTYTHISGVYTYYTGEANINTNFPDYTLPYTGAHEMAHQRGFAREKEANFVAFLVCERSDDDYIKYSGKLNMLEYLLNAIYTASPEKYMELFYSLDIRVRCDMVAYSNFFDTYRDSTASEISSAINDTYLKSQGQAEGEKSYGLVVDLAVAYILDKNDTITEA